MRTIGTHVPRPYGTSSDAQQKLIDDLGGLEKAAAYCERGKSMMQAYADHHQPDKTMPLHVIERLQQESKTNPITEYLANLAGMLLIELPEANAHMRWLEHISNMTREFSDILEKTSKYLADDGDIDASEARDLLRELDEHLQVVGDMRVAVQIRAETRQQTVA